jgi:hypothetical protein
MIFWHWVLHAFYAFSGADNEAGPTYGTWSGIAGATAVFSGVLLGMRHVNCKKSWCPRIGHFPDVRGVKWCGRHHPDHKGRKPTMEMLHRLHHEHKQALSGGQALP